MTRTYPSDFWLNCALAGMELCWLGAWVNYFALMIFSAPYPWPNALAAFFGAGLAMWLGRRGRRRVYQVGLIHLLLMVAVVLWGLHSYYGQGAVLWNPSWIRTLAAGTAGVKEMMTVGAIIAFSLLFWFSGHFWYKRERDYETTSHRFDCGLGLLLGLLLVKFLLRVRFEVFYSDPFSPALSIGFFLLRPAGPGLVTKPQPIRAARQYQRRPLALVFGHINHRCGSWPAARPPFTCPISIRQPRPATWRCNRFWGLWCPTS